MEGRLRRVSQGEGDACQCYSLKDSQQSSSWQLMQMLKRTHLLLLMHPNRIPSHWIVAFLGTSCTCFQPIQRLGDLCQWFNFNLVKKSSKDVDLLASLCYIYNTSEDELRKTIEKANNLIADILKKKKPCLVEMV